MLKLTGGVGAKGTWTLDPFNGPPSIPNIPPPPATPQYTVTVTSQGFVQPASTSATERLGRSMGVTGSTLIIGAADFSGQTGRAQLYSYDGTNWNLTSTLSNPAATSGGYFGSAIAASNDWFVVGAPLNNISSQPVGAVYLYNQSGGVWPTSPTQTIHTNTQPNFWFGTSVDMDGSTMVTGAYLDTAGSTAQAGQVYIYTLSGGVWSQQGSAVNAGVNAAANSRYGWSVAVSGNVLVVGAPGESSGNGAAYVYTRSGSTWSFTTRLVPSSPISGSAFGVSVRVKGSTIVIGASDSYSEAASAGGSTSAVYVFNNNAGTWTQTQVLNVTTTTGGTLVDANYGGGGLGQSVDISSDEKVIIAGGYKATANSKTNGGAVYVFEKVNGTWGPSAISNSSSSLRAPSAGVGTAAEYFGYSVRFNGSAVVAAVPYRNGSTTLLTQRGGFFYFK